MSVDVTKYPSVIAQPYYLSIKNTPQRKDYQRFLLENTVSFLAVFSIANILDIYETFQDDEDNKFVDDVLKIKDRLRINLDRMSLGLWNHVLRDTTSLIKDYKNDVLVPELYDYYHGSKSKKIVGIINKLITIRNHDAHGNPISEDKLEHELNSRQELLDQLVESVSFICNYQLFVTTFN